MARVRDRFHQLVDALTAEDLEAATVTRASGMESVRLDGGGWVRFGSASSQFWRGLSVDTVCLPAAATEWQRATILPCLAKSRGSLRNRWNMHDRLPP
jgi:hypothetical protein